MIIVIFKTIANFLKWIFKLIPYAFIMRSLLFFVLIIIITISQSLLFRYITMTQGIFDTSNSNYSSAITNISQPQSFFAIEGWKQMFNLGVVEFLTENQEHAREYFDQAKGLLNQTDNTYELCMIDINTAFSFEHSALDAINEGQERSANRAANFYLNAFIKRQQISQDCQILGAQAIKNNDDNTDKIKQQYNNLATSALGNENININSQISEQVNSFDEHLQNSKSDNHPIDEKIEELAVQNTDSQIEYKNTQELKKKAEKLDEKNIKPW